MTMLNKILDLLGFGSSESSSEDRDVGVTVEREGPAGGAEASAESDGGTRAESSEDATAPEDAASGDDGGEVATETDDPAADDDESGAVEDEESRVPSEAVDVVKGIGPTYAERLSNVGIETVADLAEADASDVAERAEVPEGRLEDWIERAKARAR